MFKNRLITTIVLLLSFYLIFNLSQNTYRLWQKTERVKDAQEERVVQEKKNKELKEKLEESQSKDFIEREAREKLGLVKPGETVVIIPPIEATESAMAGNLPNWKKWWRLFF